MWQLFQRANTGMKYIRMFKTFIKCTNVTTSLVTFTFIEMEITSMEMKTQYKLVISDNLQSQQNIPVTRIYKLGYLIEII